MSGPHAPQDPIEVLLRAAKPNVTPDAARMERAMRNVHREWQAALASRRRVRWLAVAAGCAAIALTGALIFRFQPVQPLQVATVTRVLGDVVIRHVEGGAVQVDSLRAGRVLSSGEEIDTGVSGRVLLSMVSGAQLRVDTGTISQWRSPRELHLTSGAVYVETSASTAARPLIVSTPLGDVRHVGTRFEVRVSKNQTRVRVRDGKVSFTRKDGQPVVLTVGQELLASHDTTGVQPGPGSAAPDWQWTREIGPALAIEGRSVFEALAWLGSETGLPVRYTNERAQSLAHATILHGSIDGLDTRAALLAVLSGSGLAFELRPDRIEVRGVDAR